MTSLPPGSPHQTGERPEALPGTVLAALAAQAEEQQETQRHPSPQGATTDPRLEADRLRGEYLLAVHDGLVTRTDVVLAARRNDGKPLRSIPLRRLASEAEHSSTTGRRVAHLMSAVTATLDGDGDTKVKTIKWLVDTRKVGHRIFVWLDAHDVKKQSPSPGFPGASARRTAA